MVSQIFMPVKFGPSGLGGVKEAISNLEKYKALGFTACELAFTYGAYIKKKEDAEKIKNAAEKLGIQLTIHGPYWINLNSEDKEKIKKSKERILESCKVGTLLGAKKVVIHPGFYGKLNQRESYENIKREILELEKNRKGLGFSCKIALETTGKINVFGSVDEILKLVEEPGCD